MLKNGLIITLGALLVTATPANAGSNSGNDRAKSTPTSETAKEKKYCVKETNTGTHLSSSDCRTKAEWAREGIDITEFVKNK